MKCLKRDHFLLRRVRPARISSTWRVLVAAGLLFARGVLVAEEKETGPVPLEAMIPDDVIAYAHFVGVTGRVEAFFESELKKEIVSNPLFEVLRENRQLRRGWRRLRELEETTGLDLVKLLREVFQHEIALGVFLDFSGPQGVVLARCRDNGAARELVKQMRDAASEAIEDPFEGTESEYGGETIETFKFMALAVIDNLVAIASHGGVLESVIDLTNGKTTRSILNSKTFAPVVGDSRPLVQFALRLNFLPAVRLPDRLDSMASLIFGGWLGAVRGSDLLAVDLDLEKDRLVLRGTSRVRPEILGGKYEPWFPASEVDPAAKLVTDHELAVVRLHRDLAAWWSNRSEFVAARDVEEMAEFARYASIAFGGRSFESEVLSQIGSPITLVARRQERAGRTPQPALPAFAAILPLADPAADFSDGLLAAFQKLVGIGAFEHARKAPGVDLVLRTKEIDGTELHYVDVRKWQNAETPRLIDNFSPSLAIAGAHAILSSTRELAETLIGHLKTSSGRQKTAEAPSGSSAARPIVDEVVLDGAEVRRVLEDNFPLLVDRSARDRGTSTEEAEGDVRAAVSLLELLERLRFRSVLNGDLLRLDLELSLARPALVEPQGEPSGRH